MGRQPAGKRPRHSKENMAAVLHTPDASAPRDKVAITTGLRKGARQRRSGAALHAEEQDELLPPELLQIVGGALEGPDLAAASLVCKLWSRSLRGGESGAVVAREAPVLAAAHAQRCWPAPLTSLLGIA